MTAFAIGMVVGGVLASLSMIVTNEIVQRRRRRRARLEELARRFHATRRMRAKRPVYRGQLVTTDDVEEIEAPGDE